MVFVVVVDIGGSLDELVVDRVAVGGGGDDVGGLLVLGLGIEGEDDGVSEKEDEVGGDEEGDKMAEEDDEEVRTVTESSYVERYSRH